MNIEDLGNLKNFDEDAWHDIVSHTDPKLLYAPHIDEKGRFFNPWMKKTFTVSYFKKTLDYLKTKPKAVPKEEEYVSIAGTHYKFKKDDSTLAFLGHSSFVISLDSNLIFTDPFFSKFAAIMKKSVNVTVDFDSLPKEPVVLISHNHYDHLDKISVKRLIDRNALFIVPLKLRKYFKRLGAAKVYELDWWESVTAGGIKYTLLPAQHWSVRVGQPVNTTLWGSFMIEGTKTIYFSGDTGYFAGFKEFGRVFPNIDIALLAVGAYHPRWQKFYQHQSVDEFFMALDDLKAKTGIPMHYGTIRLGKETIDFPAYEVETKLTEIYKDKVKILKICEKLDMHNLNIIKM